MHFDLWAGTDACGIMHAKRWLAATYSRLASPLRRNSEGGRGKYEAKQRPLPFLRATARPKARRGSNRHHRDVEGQDRSHKFSTLGTSSRYELWLNTRRIAWVFDH